MAAEKMNAMKKASSKFKRGSLKLTKEEQRRLYRPLTSVLIDIRLPVAMQLAFEAGWKAAILSSRQAKKRRPK